MHLNSRSEHVTPSNIVRIFNCVDCRTSKPGGGDEEEEERGQIAYYERGVGSVGNILTKAGQGLTGHGINTKIKIMYHWLGVNWREYEDENEEDRLFLFGFSRGAFAVRSLMGMIYRVGLLDLSGLDAQESYRRVEIAFEQGYKNQKPKSAWAKGNKSKKSKNDGSPWSFFGDKEHGRIPIHFIGAFDTVGQLGLPRESWLLWTCGALCYFTPGRTKFHDVTVNETVRNGYHAVAMDEMRSTFQPVFDRARQEDTNDRAVQKHAAGEMRIRQVWFPGGHANVGGGVLDTGLSDGALKWMVDQAANAGLRFQQNMIDQIKPNFQGNIFHKHGTTLYKNLTYYPRSVPAVIPDNCYDYHPDKIETVHISALQRSENPRITQAPYFTTTYLQVGEELQTIVSAANVYNSTHVFLEAGATYVVTAEGIWSGIRRQECGPEGYSKMDLLCHPSTYLKSGIGRIERGFRFLTGNREARLPLTRRHDKHPWFSVMGMVASGGTRNVIAKADFHAVFFIGKKCEYQVGKNGGYLYCYANDTWAHYGKNKGHMMLTIKRTK